MNNGNGSPWTRCHVGSIPATLTILFRSLRMEVTPLQVRMQTNQQRNDTHKYYYKIKSEEKGTKGKIILNALKYYYENRKGE